MSSVLHSPLKSFSNCCFVRKVVSRRRDSASSSSYFCLSCTAFACCFAKVLCFYRACSRLVSTFDLTLFNVDIDSLFGIVGSKVTNSADCCSKFGALFSPLLFLRRSCTAEKCLFFARKLQRLPMAEAAAVESTICCSCTES
jgi:hypothetical protein